MFSTAYRTWITITTEKNILRSTYTTANYCSTSKKKSTMVIFFLQIILQNIWNQAFLLFLADRLWDTLITDQSVRRGVNKKLQVAGVIWWSFRFHCFWSVLPALLPHMIREKSEGWVDITAKHASLIHIPTYALCLDVLLSPPCTWALL